MRRVVPSRSAITAPRAKRVRVELPTMQHDEFAGQVQQRTEQPSRAHAIRVTRAVLGTLGERLQPGEAKDLAGPLPMEIDQFLLAADSGQRFDHREFVHRVAEVAGVEEPDAARYAQEVLAVVNETVYASEMQEVYVNLPDDYDPLFALVEEDAVPPD